MRSIILCDGVNALNTTTTRYHILQGVGSWTGTTYLSQLASVPGTFSNARVKVSAAPGAGKSWTFTLMKNDAATALVVTVSGTDTTGEDTTHSFTVVAGDRLYWRCVPSATPAAAVASLTVDFDSTADKASLCLGAPGNGTSGIVTGYMPVQSGQQNSFASEAVNEGIIPTAGKLKNFYIKCLSLGVSFGSITFTLRVNGVDTALTVTVNSTATFSDTANEVTVAAGDAVAIKWSNAGGTVAEIFGFGMDFEPTRAGESIVMNTLGAAMSNVQTRYRVPCAHHLAGWSATESAMQQVAGDFVAGKFFCELSANPTSGSYTLTIRKNGADTPITLVIVAPNTTGNDQTHSSSISDGDLLSVEATPSADPVPGAVSVRWGFVIDASGLFGAWSGDVPANDLVKGAFL